jgi:predicted alpha/beta superfamily hydrolase
MRNFIFFGFSFLIFSIFGQTESVIDSLFSKSLQQMRKIKIQVHGNTSLDLPMHTVYVLDAQNENLFQLVNNLIYFQRDEIAPILVVGIISVNRNKEFLDQSEIAQDIVNYGSDMGGSKSFNYFFQNELIPFIEGKYPVSDKRWAIGHSNGARFLLHQWIENPQLFSARLFVDPNFTYMENRISTDIVNLGNSEQHKTLSYFCNAFYPQDPENWKNDSRIGMSSLQKLFGKSSNWKSENFEKEFNHYSVIPIACQNGLNYILSNTFENPAYLIEYISKNYKNEEVRNSEVLKYFLSLDLRGFKDLAKKTAIIIDRDLTNIGFNSLDVRTNFDLGIRFEGLKMYNSALLLYKNCLAFLKNNAAGMEKEQLENYTNLIQTKIENLKSRVN